MKTLLISLVLGFITLFNACRKDNLTTAPPKSLKKHSVTMTLDAFTETLGEVKSSSSNTTLDDPLANNVSILYSRFYDTTTGKLVYTSDQNSSATTFGTIATELSEGNYTAVFVGSQSTVQLNTSNAIPLSSAGFNLSQNTAIFDTFYTKISFTVSNAPVLKSVKLNRVIAGLSIVAEDAVPANVNRVEIIIPQDPYMFKFADSTRTGSTARTITFPVTATDHGTINKNFNTYAFAAGTSQTITIKVYDASNTVLFEKNIPNVPFYTNKTSRLTGKLFSNKASLDITVNPNWDTPPPIVNF